MFTSNNLRDLQKLVPLASARTDRNGVRVFGRVEYHSNIQKHTYLSEEETKAYIVQLIKDNYENAIRWQRMSPEEREWWERYWNDDHPDWQRPAEKK